MRNNLYICNANPQTKTTLTSPISGSNFGTHYTELEKQLKYEKMKAEAYDTMIDIAEKKFSIPIRKKAGAKR